MKSAATGFPVSHSHQAGDQIGRVIQFQFNYGSQPVLVEPLDSNRLDHTTIWDLRAEKLFRFTGRTVSAFVDVYNISNSNSEFRRIFKSGRLVSSSKADADLPA